MKAREWKGILPQISYPGGWTGGKGVTISGWTRRGPRDRGDGGVLGHKQPAPSLPARGLGERCKLPSEVRGKAPAEIDLGAFSSPVEAIFWEQFLSKNDSLEPLVMIAKFLPEISDVFEHPELRPCLEGRRLYCVRAACFVASGAFISWWRVAVIRPATRQTHYCTAPSQYTSSGDRRSTVRPTRRTWRVERVYCREYIDVLNSILHARRPATVVRPWRLVLSSRIHCYQLTRSSTTSLLLLLLLPSHLYSVLVERGEFLACSMCQRSHSKTASTLHVITTLCSEKNTPFCFQSTKTPVFVRKHFKQSICSMFLIFSQIFDQVLLQC